MDAVTSASKPTMKTAEAERAHGFEATEYTLRTDQLGTQLDPPAHWAPEYPTIDELPASYVTLPPGSALLHVTDIDAWENKHGRIPEGSVVFVAKWLTRLRYATMECPRSGGALR
jgi:kynurenine formamidase